MLCIFNQPAFLASPLLDQLVTNQDLLAKPHLVYAKLLILLPRRPAMKMEQHFTLLIQWPSQDAIFVGMP